MTDIDKTMDCRMVHLGEAIGDVFPLFFGVRKMAYSSMGLGLLDDADV